MKSRIVKSILLALGLLLFLPCRAAARKALVYMFDGMRGDVMEAVNAPVWQALKEGSWAEGYRRASSPTRPSSATRTGRPG